MNRNLIETTLATEPEYDDWKEDNYFSMARGFFDRRNRISVIIVFTHFFIFLFLAIVCGVLFWQTDQIKDQIMYAAFFTASLVIAYCIKIFGWIMGTRNSLHREIKRLELKIHDLSESLKSSYE